MNDGSSLTCFARIDGEVRALSGRQLEGISEIRARPGALVWLDIARPAASEMGFLADEFGVHALAIEDVRNRGQRTKMDTYTDQHVIVAYEVLPSEAANRSGRLGELHLFAGPGYVISAHWEDSPAIASIRKRFSERAEAVGTSVGGLLYAILDAIVDGYFPLIDALNERIEDLEDRVVGGDHGSGTLREVLGLKREMLELRRVLAPLRDVANALLRRDVELIDDEALPYYRDLYDHLIRVLDSLDLFRDLVAAALDANLAVTNNNLNAVMKRLTAFTVVLMLPTLIAGIYGMNFDNMPELGWPFGYFAALGLMATIMVGAATYFRRRNWF